MVIDIQAGKRFLQKLSRGFDGDGVNGNLLFLENPCGPSCEQNVKRADDLASAVWPSQPETFCSETLAIQVWNTEISAICQCQREPEDAEAAF